MKVTIEDDLLFIAGEKKVEHIDDKTHFSKRSYGSFTRSFRLPADADAEKISARYGKGVLTLEIAKRANGASRAKEIEIRPS